MVIVPQEVSKPWPMAFGTLAGDIPDDARTLGFGSFTRLKKRPLAAKVTSLEP